MVYFSLSFLGLLAFSLSMCIALNAFIFFLRCATVRHEKMGILQVSVSSAICYGMGNFAVAEKLPSLYLSRFKGQESRQHLIAQKPKNVTFQNMRVFHRGNTLQGIVSLATIKLVSDLTRNVSLWFTGKN